ncbi:PhzF family phenazine biosynthesis protein [Teredinibacter waterburyi]|jgi:phenazine biosynthesis protein PhzF family|uniref:PhzF family phenazine biosynthesis protein n=1 Tax=Teredinibacter waterburyi TaxID=1500538 RepID=UPI00165F1C61|nr:PhzF family phenazine biosynthesis protein [Teredinibacter waterburyi]
MELSLYQVDAFTNKAFSGNPAAVYLLEQPLAAALMQNIALEMNLSETVFLVPNGEAFDIRWFTPQLEIDLCGHATLASAHVLFNHYGFKGDCIQFNSKSGRLTASRNGDLITLDFPARPLEPVTLPSSVSTAMGVTPQCAYGAEGSNKLLLVFASADELKSLTPDMNALKQLPYQGFNCTALGGGEAGADVDFVCRYFAPAAGIDEDPVTGSAYTNLAPYWVNQLGNTQFKARQLSARGGELQIELAGDRVLISGQSVTTLVGTLMLSSE